ncbi:MAG: hypothetical protein RLZZ303_2382 [Candidatus Hydrogenedentota bacterium]|jgi:hypothetical protein
MPVRRNKPDPEKRKAFVEQVKRERETRATGYREMALRLFPHVCGRCGREFSGKRLKELTVHHKDNNHFNNPPDGSNWELLCLYCHDDVHQTDVRRSHYTGDGVGDKRSHTLGHSPFEGLRGNDVAGQDPPASESAPEG